MPAPAIITCLAVCVAILIAFFSLAPTDSKWRPFGRFCLLLLGGLFVYRFGSDMYALITDETHRKAIASATTTPTPSSETPKPKVPAPETPTPHPTPTATPIPTSTSAPSPDGSGAPIEEDPVWGEADGKSYYYIKLVNHTSMKIEFLAAHGTKMGNETILPHETRYHRWSNISFAKIVFSGSSPSKRALRKQWLIPRATLAIPSKQPQHLSFETYVFIVNKFDRIDLVPAADEDEERGTDELSSADQRSSHLPTDSVDLTDEFDLTENKAKIDGGYYWIRLFNDTNTEITFRVHNSNPERGWWVIRSEPRSWTLVHWSLKQQRTLYLEKNGAGASFVETEWSPGSVVFFKKRQQFIESIVTSYRFQFNNDGSICLCEESEN